MSDADAERLGFDPARLARIDRFVRERYLDTGLLAQAQLLIARDGEVAHFSSQGLARDGGKPVDEGSLFRIASMTKPITSIAFMQLVEDGLVAVDTPVHHVLPEFKGLGVYAGGGAGVPFQVKPTTEPMRMLDLLRHTSGLTYGFQNRTNIARRSWASGMAAMTWRASSPSSGNCRWSSRQARHGIIRYRRTCSAR